MTCPSCWSVPLRTACSLPLNACVVNLPRLLCCCRWELPFGASRRLFTPLCRAALLLLLMFVTRPCHRRPAWPGLTKAGRLLLATACRSASCRPCWLQQLGLWAADRRDASRIWRHLAVRRVSPDEAAAFRLKREARVGLERGGLRAVQYSI